jgi:hypothetical protein
MPRSKTSAESLWRQVLQLPPEERERFLAPIVEALRGYVQQLQTERDELLRAGRELAEDVLKAAQDDEGPELVRELSARLSESERKRTKLTRHMLGYVTMTVEERKKRNRQPDPATAERDAKIHQLRNGGLAWKLVAMRFGMTVPGAMRAYRRHEKRLADKK